LLRICQCQI